METIENYYKIKCIIDFVVPIIGITSIIIINWWTNKK